MRLLIVDDHAPTRAMIRDFLAPLCTRITECDSGEAAMNACLAAPPDMVTLDLRLGTVDGFAVLAFLRKVCPSVHVAVVTQFDEPDVRTLVQRLGALCCFAKSELPQLRKFVEGWRRGEHAGGLQGQEAEKI